MSLKSLFSALTLPLLAPLTALWVWQHSAVAIGNDVVLPTVGQVAYLMFHPTENLLQMGSMAVNVWISCLRVFGGYMAGLMLALPIITLLLTVNLALGLLNRMAPQLSVFVIGFPLTLTVGILLMSLLMPLIAPFCEHLFGEIFNLLADIVSELPRK